MGWQVECHSGYEYAERPVAFCWEGERLQIEAIEGEWRVPDGKRFRVRTQGGRIFELLYAERRDEWRVQPLVWPQGSPGPVGRGGPRDDPAGSHQPDGGGDEARET